MTLDGHEVAHIPQTGGFATAHGLFFQDPDPTQAKRGEAFDLKRLNRDGSVDDLVRVDGGGAQLVGAAVSPDGARWVAGIARLDDAANEQVTDLYSGEGGSGRLVATLRRPSLPYGGYMPLRWDDKGILVGSFPSGVGGAGPFIGEGYSLSAVERLDPQTWKAGPALAASDCRFGDLAADGTLACVTRGPNAPPNGFRLVHPDGSTTSIAAPEGDELGQLMFVGDSDTLTFATAKYNDANQSSWTYTAWVLDAGRTTPRKLLADATVRGDLGGGRVLVAAGWAEMLDLSTGTVTRIIKADGLIGVVG